MGTFLLIFYIFNINYDEEMVNGKSIQRGKQRKD